MKSLFTTALILILLLPASALALDGDREGFNFGGGIGFSPYVRYSYAGFFGDEYRSGSEDKVGVAFHLGAGHGISLEQVFRFEINGVVFDDNTYGGKSVQAFVGLAYYHYLEFGLDTFHFVIGGGWYTLLADKGKTNNAHFGGLVGVGYNLSYSTEVTLFFGNGDTEFDQARYTHLNLGLMLSTWVY